MSALPVVPISDGADGRLSDYRDLTDRQLRQLREHAEGFFIAEGELALRAAAEVGWPVRSVLLTAEKLASLEPVVDRLEATVFVAPRSVMDAVGGFKIHRGVLAAVARPDSRPWRQLIPHHGPVLLAEEVNDLENMGSLFRAAAAFGAQAVILSPRCADPLYRRCVRVSLGHVMRVPFAVADDWPEPLSHLSSAGWRVAGLSPVGATSLDDLPASRRTALVVGAEGPGLSARALAACTDTVRIEMSPAVDSLNVAVAAAIALHEVGRRARQGDTRQTAE